jgi:hypothetical protein
MTNDHADPSSRVDDETRSQSSLQGNYLRALLELPLLKAVSRLATEGDFDQSALREELRAVCAEAKRSGVRAEQVLIAVKEIWAALPVAREIARNEKGKPFINAVVTMTLEEYYESPHSRS